MIWAMPRANSLGRVAQPKAQQNGDELSLGCHRCRILPNFPTPDEWQPISAMEKCSK